MKISPKDIQETSKKVLETLQKGGFTSVSSASATSDFLLSSGIARRGSGLPASTLIKGK
jgi:hypothetical protein